MMDLEEQIDEAIQQTEAVVHGQSFRLFVRTALSQLLRSVTHLGHGVFVYGTIRGFLTTWPPAAAVVATLAVEAIWKLVENTPWAIAAYRRSGDIQYQGDSVLNALGDLLCCVAAAWLTSCLV